MALSSKTVKRLLTLALAAVGTFVFWMASFPLPFLFGPMFACLVAALLGAPLVGVGQVAVGTFVFWMASFPLRPSYRAFEHPNTK